MASPSQSKSTRRGRGKSKSTSKKTKTASKSKVTKTRAKKTRSTKNKTMEEKPEITVQEVAKKTFESLENLGNQKFALSPFSQYFDDWLINVKSTISEFETNAPLKFDKVFEKQRDQILDEIQSQLAEIRIKEGELEEAAKELSETNHLLGDLDATYASKNRELSEKRNKDVEKMTKEVHDLEDQLEQAKMIKTSFFRPSTKREKKLRIEEATMKLESAKNSLEVVLKNFTLEQEKLHDSYEKQKQEAIEKGRSLEEKIKEIEVDASQTSRQTTAQQLKESVEKLIQRKTKSSTA